MKIQSLFRLSSKNRKYLAQYVRILGQKTGYTKEGLGYLAARTQSTHRLDENGFLVPVRARNRTTYLSMILFVDQRLNVRVSCSCEDFKFMYEWALHNRKAADIEYSNGEPPNIKNPQYKPALCKHLCALYLKVADRIP